MTVPKVTFKLTRHREHRWKPLNAKLRSFQEIAGRVLKSFKFLAARSKAKHHHE